MQRMLRESWRAVLYNKWRDSARLDANCASPYEAGRVVAARRAAMHSAHHLAVLTGAAVSPACYRQMAQRKPASDPFQAIVCPHCALSADRAHWSHVTWQCRDADCDSCLTERDCFDTLQRRLGWPTGKNHRHSLDMKILDCLAQCRERILDQQHPQSE